MDDKFLKKAIEILETKMNIEIRYIGGRYYLQYWDDYATPIQILITENEAKVLQEAIKDVL